MKTKTITTSAFLRVLIVGIIICSFTGMSKAQAQADPKTEGKPSGPVASSPTKEQIKQDRKNAGLMRKAMRNMQANQRRNQRVLSLNPRRYYYDFFTRKLFFTPDSRSEEIFRPLSYRANKDIQIEIFNYNPLKEQIIIESSFSERFLADTGVFARFVILPKVSEGKLNVKPDTIANKKAGSKPLIIDCEALNACQKKFDDLNETITEDILKYQDFLSRIEIIQDDYNYLKQLDILSGPAIINRLESNFLVKLNEFLPTGKEHESIETVSSRELSGLETQYFTKITETEKELDKIKKEVSQLTDKDCKDYVNLNHKFNDAYSELKEKITELKSKRSDKILPSFNKTLLLFDMLQKYYHGVPNFVTPALTIDKDLHTINIYKKEEGSNDKVLHDNINIEPIRGWKIDFSTGVFITGLYDAKFTKKSKDSIYATKYVSNGVVRDTIINKTFSSINKTHQIPVSFGGMIFLHAHTQNPNLFNYGCYIGFGALFNDQTRWTMSLGGSFIIGKKQRFNINAGAAIAQIERLQQPYKTDTWYTDALDNIPTTKVWKLSYLLGFSWNIK